MEHSENSNLTAYSSGSDSNMAASGQLSPSSSKDAEDREPDVFFFESDHLALKGNKDYQTMLRTICHLEAQRIQAAKDLSKLLDCEKRALADPIKFVEELQNRVDQGFPDAIKVTPLPIIHWEKYTNSADPMNIAFRKHMTTRKRQHGLDHIDASFGGTHPEKNTPSTTITNPSSSTNPNTSVSVENGSNNAMLPGGVVQPVRGRVAKSEKSSETFNQLWTADEQKQLEELLLVHGPEEIEARRWAKIAEALGNRTAQQVASRVQKYFIRLAKAGLPIPGRMPNINSYLKKNGSHRHQRFNRMYFQPSTFMQSHLPPVYMPDHEDDEDSNLLTSAYNKRAMANEDISDEEDVPPEKRLTVEYQELMRLKRLRRKKVAEQRTNEHIGYKCDQCGCEPIVGTRWHCADCPEEVSVDFCDECMDCQFDNGTHQPHHRLDPVHHTEEFTTTGTSSSSGYQRRHHHVDMDYVQGTQQGHYNYLDPNYMPAS